MITNREEVLENALRVFAKMNYEKASLVTIAKACGLSKWGLIYYYPFKQDLFNAVVEQQPAGVQLQLLLLPPADASAAILPRRPSEVRRSVRERPQAVARQHRAGEGGRRNPRGRGHGRGGRHVPRGVLRPVLRTGVPLRAGHGRTPPQAPLHLFTD